MSAPTLGTDTSGMARIIQTQREVLMASQHEHFMAMAIEEAKAATRHDAGDGANNFQSRTMPSPTWHDIMSYCDDEWLSAYCLHSGMDRLRAENELPGNLPRLPSP